MEKKMIKIVARKFKDVLVKKGLLSIGGARVVKGVKGEDALLEKWKQVAEGFIFKGLKVEVDMEFERMNFNETFCYPVVCIKE